MVKSMIIQLCKVVWLEEMLDIMSNTLGIGSAIRLHYCEPLIVSMLYSVGLQHSYSITLSNHWTYIVQQYFISLLECILRGGDMAQLGYGIVGVWNYLMQLAVNAS